MGLRATPPLLNLAVSSGHRCLCAVRPLGWRHTCPLVSTPRGLTLTRHPGSPTAVCLSLHLGRTQARLKVTVPAAPSESRESWAQTGIRILPSGCGILGVGLGDSPLDAISKLE